MNRLMENTVFLGFVTCWCFAGLTNQPLTLICKPHNRRRSPRAGGIDQYLGASAFHHGNTRVRGAQVNSIVLDMRCSFRIPPGESGVWVLLRPVPTPTLCSRMEQLTLPKTKARPMPAPRPPRHALSPEKPVDRAAAAPSQPPPPPPASSAAFPSPRNAGPPPPVSYPSYQPLGASPMRTLLALALLSISASFAPGCCRTCNSDTAAARSDSRHRRDHRLRPSPRPLVAGRYRRRQHPRVEQGRHSRLRPDPQRTCTDKLADALDRFATKPAKANKSITLENLKITARTRREYRASSSASGPSGRSATAPRSEGSLPVRRRPGTSSTPSSSDFRASPKLELNDAPSSPSAPFQTRRPLRLSRPAGPKRPPQVSRPPEDPAITAAAFAAISPLPHSRVPRDGRGHRHRV